MRELADSTRIEQFMRALGRAAKDEGKDSNLRPTDYESRRNLSIEPDLA
jgi:hypothetical protein